MNIDRYLARINYVGPLTVNEDTLRDLHRAHLRSIPYEILDIHLNRKLSLDIKKIFDKLVISKRGGWCYEMNGLFFWALRELGFDATLLGATMDAPAQGGMRDDEHVMILVQLTRPWLVDVGYGYGFLDPLPLGEGQYWQDSRCFQLDHENDKWYCHIRPNGLDGYGFTLQPRRLHEFAFGSTHQQLHPDSHFVRNIVCYRFTSNGIVGLHGAVFKNSTIAGETKEEIVSSQHYGAVLREVFGIDLEATDVDYIWSRVWEKHLIFKQKK